MYVHQFCKCVMSAINFLLLGVQVFRSAHYGAGTGPIFLEQLSCEGHEESVLDCEASYGLHSCTHADDVSVICEGM